MPRRKFISGVNDRGSNIVDAWTGSCIVYRADLLISLIRIKDQRSLFARDARGVSDDAAWQQLPGRGGVCEIRIGPAVGRAARCDGLTLLVAGEPTIARAGIVVALQAIPILVSCDRGYASCENGRRRREGKKAGTHFSLPR